MTILMRKTLQEPAMVVGKSSLLIANIEECTLALAVGRRRQTSTEHLTSSKELSRYLPSRGVVAGWHGP
jgi:hypothetical protein